MSLTSFLDQPDVKARFRQEFPKPSFGLRKELLAPSLTDHYSQVGTAFDYLLRFYLSYLNPMTITKGHWVAELAIVHLLDNPALRARAEEIIAQAKTRVAVFQQNGQFTDELLESALRLASLDSIFRARRGFEQIGQADARDVEDLRNLIGLVDPAVFKAKYLCLVNPTFGQASRLVGGADADLVIDETLIEIKTVKKLELKRETFDQLIGYYILHELGGVAELQPKPAIRNIAVYFSRHGYLHRMDLEALIDRSTFPTFVEWFKERAGQEMRETHLTTVTKTVETEMTPSGIRVFTQEADLPQRLEQVSGLSNLPADYQYVEQLLKAIPSTPQFKYLFLLKRPDGRLDLYFDQRRWKMEQKVSSNFQA